VQSLFSYFSLFELDTFVLGLGSSVLGSLTSSLYYFIELYVKIKIGMLDVLLDGLVK